MRLNGRGRDAYEMPPGQDLYPVSSPRALQVAGESTPGEGSPTDVRRHVIPGRPSWPQSPSSPVVTEMTYDDAGPMSMLMRLPEPEIQHPVWLPRSSRFTRSGS